MPLANRSKVEIDLLTVHSDDLGEITGEFYGTPIRLWDAPTSRTRENNDLINRLVHSQAQEAINVPAQV